MSDRTPTEAGCKFIIHCFRLFVNKPIGRKENMNQFEIESQADMLAQKIAFLVEVLTEYASDNLGTKETRSDRIYSGLCFLEDASKELSALANEISENTYKPEKG